MPVLRQNGLGADTNYFGPGGSWINNGCFIGDPADWPSFQRNYLCNLPYTSCPIPCPADTCGGGNAAACPGYVAPSQQVATPAAPNPSTSPKVVSVDIQTPEGAATVQMPEDYIPGTADHELTPARVHIPNIWDSLDPTKSSQFDYRGLSRSLPVWISQSWRDTLSDAAAPPAPAPASFDPFAAAAEYPFLIYAAIGAAAWLLRDKKGKR